MRKGADLLIYRLLALVQEEGWEEEVEVSGAYCQSLCDHGPVVIIGDRTYQGPDQCQLENVKHSLQKIISLRP